MERIKAAQKRRGVIIFTDPDFAGEKIRKKIAAEVPGCKHAFLPREEAKKDGDIGIENASPESILRALNKVRTESTDKRNEFSQVDLVINGLGFVKITKPCTVKVYTLDINMISTRKKMI